VFEASSGKVTATIPLAGKPEFAAVDSASGQVYDNIEDQNSVVVIDSAQHTITHTWPVAPGEEPSGLAMDRAHHRLFIGCGNELMVMMDSVTGKVIGSVPIDKGVDATWFDEGSQLAFASCGAGTVTIAHEDSPESLKVVQKLTTAPGARTMALDPSTHKIYLATAEYLPQAPGNANKRRQVAPGWNSHHGTRRPCGQDFERSRHLHDQRMGEAGRERITGQAPAAAELAAYLWVRKSSSFVFSSSVSGL